jgi:hypothetical protein
MTRKSSEATTQHAPGVGHSDLKNERHAPIRHTWKPVDFEGEDTSLTQAELALMK